MLYPGEALRMSGIIKAQTTCRWDVVINRYLLPIAQVWKSNRCSASGGLRFKSGWEYDGCGSQLMKYYCLLVDCYYL